MNRNILRNLASSHLVLLIVRLFAVVHGQTVQLTSTQGVDLGEYVTLRCSFSDERSFNSSSVVYRHNRNVIDDADPLFNILPKSGFVAMQTLRFRAERSSNGSYTCEPNGFGESEAAIVYVVTNDPTIEIEGPRKRVLYEDSDLNLPALVRYQADTVKLWVVHNETKRVIPCSERKERIFSNATVVLKLCRLSRFDEGSIFVKGKGLLLHTEENTFESQSIDMDIIRRPNNVSFTKEVGRNGWIELAWENTPTDPNHRYDPPISYRVELWGPSMTAVQFQVFQPNISINVRNLNVSEVDASVSVVAVGKYTESRPSSTRISTGLPNSALSALITPEIPTSENPTPFFTSKMLTSKPEENATVAGKFAAWIVPGVTAGVVIVTSAFTIVVFIIGKKGSWFCNGQCPPGDETGNEEQGNSIGLTNTEPRSTAEVKKNCRTASGNREGAEEPLSENGQQGSSTTQMEHVANADVASSRNQTGLDTQQEPEIFDLCNPGKGDSSALNLEALEMVQEQAKCTEEQLKTKADKKDVDEIKEGLKELRREKDRDVEELRGRVSELEEAPKSFTVTLTEDRSERSRLKDNCSSDRKTKEIAVYNDHFGQNEAKLTDDLDKSDPAKCTRVASSLIESFPINSPPVNQVSTVSDLHLYDRARISSGQTMCSLSSAAESNGGKMSMMSSWSDDAFDELDKACTDAASVKSSLLENLLQRLQKESVSNQIGVEGSTVALPLSDVTDAAAVKPPLLEPLHLCVYKQSVTCLPKGTVSNHIGVEGGSLTLPSCGVLLIIPPGAITSTTSLGVRLSLFVSDKPVDVEGKTAYVGVIELLPHGAVFAKPVILRYKLRHHYKRGADRIENQYRLFYGEGKEVSFEEYDFMGNLESARHPVSYKGIMDVYLRDSCVELFSTTFCRYCTVAIIGSYYVWIGFFIYPIGVYRGKRKWNLKIVISCTCSENVDKIKVNLFDKNFRFVNEKRFCCPEPSLNSGQRLEFSLNEEDEFTSNFTLTSKKEFREDELRSVVEKDNEPPFYVERDVVVKCPEQISCNQPLIFNSNYYKYYERISSSPHKRLLSRDEVLVLLNTGSEASSDYRVSDSDVSEHSQERRSTDEVREASYATAPRKGERLCESTASILSTSGSSLPKNVDYNLKMAVAELAQAKWQRLLLCLGLDERVISQYKEQTYDNVVRACQIISDWKLREGIQASVSKLITACDKCGISKDEILKEYTERGLWGTRVETAV
ncbi:uncharacterized protein [Oscarella lobularis]|uniref:uncharacterized protein isoform X2 n=1 Tax=Oscarella lobularis TaxID=121494 RepID=UPI0033133A58